MNNIVYPDYDNSILNTIAAVMKHYGVDTKYNENQKLMELLDKNYKNVVLMIFDGMGVDILESLLQKDDILRANITAEVTSVYPSTTTAAMTAYYSGLSPFEHGWLGWSLYFKEYGRCLDTFINRDSFSGEYLDMPNAAYYLMPYETVFDKIEKAAKGKTSCHIIQPKGIKWYGKSAWHGVSSTKEMCNLISAICDSEGSKHVFTYWPYPDTIMHETGCYSYETIENIKSINKAVEEMCKNLRDTLVIISADHGLIDSEENIYINAVPELHECLIMPPFIEPRCASFFVKPDKKEQFKSNFIARYGEDFILFTREEVIGKGILGYGKGNKKTDDFLGDFLASAIGNKCIKFRAYTSTCLQEFKGNHAGLTWKEMMVPLITIECG